MINDLDETLKHLLVDGVPLDLSEIDVVFEKPDDEWSSSLSRPTINCYLYHVAENHDLRQVDWQVSRTLPNKSNGNGSGGTGVAAQRPGIRQAVAKRRLPFRLDAFYLVTVWANEVEDEHNLLWRVLWALMRYTSSHVPPEKLKGRLAEQEWPIPIKVAQPETPIKNPTDFWSSMEVSVKPSVSVMMTIPLDPEMVNVVPLVLTRRVKVYNEQAEGEDKIELPAVQFGGWVWSSDGDDAERVQGASVRIVEKGLETTTDDEGRFKFDYVPHGHYTLRATAAGVTAERRIEVPGNEYDLALQPSKKEKAGGKKGG